MADVKTEGDKGLNGLLRGRIKQDQNVNVGGRARLNHRPMHTEHIVGRTRREAQSTCGLGLLLLSCPFFC